MTREIKFRGRTLNKKWVYGDLLHYTNRFESNEANNGSIIVIDYKSKSDNSFKIVIPETVGQFTGLLDKNGKEIYEGDIVRGNCGNGEVRHLISFYDMIASFVAEILPDKDINDYCALSQIWILKYNKEVIGNIHDNPELLEGDKK